MKIVAFCVLDENYIDPAIVALRSFCQWNSTIPVIAYLEKCSNNYSRLKEALNGYNVTFREVDFPKEEVFQYAGGKFLLIPYSGMKAISQRLKCLDELKDKYDLIVNFDLDTLFCNSISKAIANADEYHIYGVDEKENRNKWIESLGLTEWVPGEKYFNTGFVIYGSKVLQKFDIYDSYIKAMQSKPERFNCPEQDWLNYLMHEDLILLRPCFNMMFTDKFYFSMAPVMIHFYGSLKPWNSKGKYTGDAGFYNDKYRKVAEQISRWLTPEFLKMLEE